MWKIGDINFDGKVVLAPMAGYTSFGYRHFMEQFHPALTYTEMISDMGLIYDNQETKDYLNFPETSIPCVVQLFGHDPECLVKAAKKVKELSPFTRIIDINMACPVKKVTKTGAGSSLLSNPSLAGEIVRKIKEETGLIVTAKIRLGLDDNHLNYLEVIEELEKGGVSAIALHARTAKDLYIGKPRFNLIKDLKSKMHVPLIISGNIYTLEDAINALEITKADAIMVARGGVGNPFLISQINHYYQTGEKLIQPSVLEQIDYCLELAEFLIKEKGEKKAMMIYRSIAPHFFSGFAKCKTFRTKIATQMTDLQSLKQILQEIKGSI